MTLSTRVRSELFSIGLDDRSPMLIKLSQTRPFGTSNTKKKATKKLAMVANEATPQGNLDRKTPPRHGQPWTTEEHELFLQALEIHPTGPWKDVASFVGTRTTRQVMTHAQKYREKIKRRRRGLSTPTEHPGVAAKPQQQDDWFDHVSLEDIDAAFRYFQELDDPTLFLTENDELPDCDQLLEVNLNEDGGNYMAGII
ncbi:Myb domain [Phytophthora cactorum]|nr:Myb domain [Phytophthora cactorum]